MFPPRSVNLFRYKFYRLFLKLKETNQKIVFLSVLSGALETRGQNLQVDTNLGTAEVDLLMNNLLHRFINE